MSSSEQPLQSIPKSRPPSYLPFDEEETISLLDILLVIARNRRMIGMAAAISVAVGLMIAVFSPSEYTASARMIRETQSENSGALI